ncbi:MAG: Gfo/Idh/MocA family oxidoreductase [Bdellovibrionales bacterium]|nr:Gfo/Idh/MocA family oxidoreductase [Bdellovibrionales bacterium]
MRTGKPAICVVGAGRWGKNHIQTLVGLESLGGVVDQNEETLRFFKAKFPHIQTFLTVEAALAAGFDGFTVATPADTHFEVASQILRRRKPVLVEKPITLCSEDARELRRIAQENRVLLMTGHVLLFHPAIQKIKFLIESGKLGHLQYVYSNRVNLGTVRTEENILWSFAPHDISIFQYLIGTHPTEIISRGGAFLQPHIHDTTLTTLRYPNNVVAHNFVSWLHPFKEHRVVVIGTKGMLSFDDSSGEKELLFFEKGIDWVKGEPVTRDGAAERIEYGSVPPLTVELQYFLDHLHETEVPISGADNAVQVLEILEAASRSLAGSDAIAAMPDTSNARLDRATTPEMPEVFVHPTSIVDEHVSLGAGTKVWHFSHIQSNASLGKNCSVGQNVNIGNNVRIGNHVKIQNNVSVYEGVELEDYVFCGPSMVFTNVLEPRCKYPQRGSQFYLRTLVREGASIGANATIVCGTTIGRHALIGAGAVVTKDVPDYALMAGVPARRIGWVCECGERLDSSKSESTCSRCHRQYSLQGDRITPAEATSVEPVGNERQQQAGR